MSRRAAAAKIRNEAVGAEDFVRGRNQPKGTPEERWRAKLDVWTGKRWVSLTEGWTVVVASRLWIDAKALAERYVPTILSPLIERYREVRVDVEPFKPNGSLPRHVVIVSKATSGDLQVEEFHFV